MARLRARSRTAAFGAVVTLTDLLPPRIRYGYVHRLTRRLFPGELPAISSRAVSRVVVADRLDATPPADVVCAILADHLDVGGIGSVVEMLALGFAAERVRPVVICHGDGNRARRLSGLGIDVISVSDHPSALAALEGSGAHVIEVHSAPPYLEQVAMTTGLPLITVLHNTEIHYTRDKWASFRTLLESSFAGIAVSATVRDFHAERVSPRLADRLTVVPNGAPSLRPATDEDRRTARLALSHVTDVDLSRAVVMVCLARYDSQKNIAATTVAFLRAARQRDDLHLVFAGDVSDPVELNRARALRDLNNGPRRIHFLGNSDAVTLLTAADAFLLNSFFEGWPVAATEAAAAGLPLILSEVGGAVELVSRGANLSVMAPNPAGDAVGISDRLVRRARRRTRHQSGADQLVAAIITVADRARDGVAPQTPPSDVGVAEMVRGHARIVRAAATANGAA